MRFGYWLPMFGGWLRNVADERMEPTWNTQLEQRVSLQDYSVSNRGLRSGLIGTPERVLDQVRAFEGAGVDLLLLQCSPQLEEMERFARQVIGPYRQPIIVPEAALPARVSEGTTAW